MRKCCPLLLLFLSLTAILSGPVSVDRKILFLTHSAGFKHPVLPHAIRIVRERKHPSMELPLLPLKISLKSIRVISSNLRLFCSIQPENWSSASSKKLIS